MRKPFVSTSVARIVAIAPLVLTLLVILALVLSASADFLGAGI